MPSITSSNFQRTNTVRFDKDYGGITIPGQPRPKDIEIAGNNCPKGWTLNSESDAEGLSDFARYTLSRDFAFSDSQPV